MFIRDVQDCEEFVAADAASLRELLHPDKTDLAIRYSLAYAVVKTGHATSPHTLKTSEVYFLLEGEGLMHVDAETSRVYHGQAIYIPPHAIQYIENTGHGDLQFLCIVDPAWRAEDEEIFFGFKKTME